MRREISISKTVFETINTGSRKKKGEEADRSKEMTEKDVIEEANHREGKHKKLRARGRGIESRTETNLAGGRWATALAGK